MEDLSDSSERSVQLKNGMERARHYATYHNLVPFNPENEANPIKQYTPVSFEFLECDFYYI